MKLMALLADSIRSQIYMHVLLKGEITAQQLMEVLPIGRSTLTHHLAKFVESDVLKFRIQALGRPTKYYSLKEMTREIALEDDKSDETLKKKILFLESAASHLQIATHITRERAKILTSQLEGKEERESGNTMISFTFNLYNKSAARIWNKEFLEFSKTVKSKLDKIKQGPDSNEANVYAAISGIFPIIRKERIKNI